MIQFGSDKIKEIYAGSDKIKEVYHGGDLVWSGEDTRGYWVHYQTGVKTYYGLNENYISQGYMGNPPWSYEASELKLPSMLLGLYDNFFDARSNLINVTIPESVLSLGRGAFAYCANLQVLTCLAVNPPNASGSFLSNTHSELQIYVPAQSVNAYKTKSPWSNYASIIIGY